MNRGFTITASGAGLLTSLLAGGQLEITKVMVGKGRLAEGQEPADLTNLIDPVALATSNTPTVSGQQVDMMVEYRNDLNGGLNEAFYLDEFGIWGRRKDSNAEPVMIYYATLGDYPQWVGPISSGLDVRRYPVAIGLASKDVTVQLNYPAGAFVTVGELNSGLRKWKADVPLVTIAHGLNSYPMVLAAQAEYALGVGGLGEGPAGGSETTQCPVRACYLDAQSLTLLVTQEVAELGTGPELHQMNAREYTVTWPGNHTHSLYIRLI